MCHVRKVTHKKSQAHSEEGDNSSEKEIIQENNEESNQNMVEEGKFV